MSLIRRRRRELPEVPLASMSDIAFLLLIFFIVAATIDSETGLGLTLPEFKPEESPSLVEKSRVTEIKIYPDSLLLNGKTSTTTGIKEYVATRAKESINLNSEDKYIVLILFANSTLYQKYIDVLDQVKVAYKSVQDDYARTKYGTVFKVLNEAQKVEVMEKVPVLISIGEIKNK
jgi:biopolymer transport protein ExbD